MQKNVRINLRAYVNIILQDWPIAGAEEAAAVERRDAAKARKAKRARQAKENDEESDPHRSDEEESVASQTVSDLVINCLENYS